jgi:hypothetical protein
VKGSTLASALSPIPLTDRTIQLLPMTAEELELLVKARDLLNAKAIAVPEGKGLLTGVADGIKLILRVSVMGDVTTMQTPPNPLVPNPFQVNVPMGAGFMPSHPRELQCSCMPEERNPECEVHGGIES